MNNVIEYLFKQARENSNKIFCVDDNEQKTYREVFDLATKIAFYIKKTLGSKNHQPIMLKAERNCKTLITILGISLSNNYYVPVNPDFSDEKLESIIESSKIEYEICFDESESKCCRLDYSEMINEDFDGNSLDLFIDDFNIENELYTIYTSGSTGKPKGVLKSQKSIIAFVNNFIETFGIQEELRIANQAPLFFDAAMKDVYLALATGATLFFPKKTLFSIPMRLVQYLNDNQINYICWVPSALSIIVRLKTFNYIKPEYLKYVFFVGEVFVPKYLNMWIEALPQITYANIYGSTELAGVCLYKIIREKLEEEKPIPLGIPLKNNSVYLDDGEIIVESDQIAIKYVNDEEKNKTVFFYKDGKKCLRTGDFACINDDGDIVFLTRKDYQIKHLGYRIELQEIELYVNSLEYIEGNAVLFDSIKDKIVTFVTLNKEMENPVKSVVSDLKTKLPDYMVPNKVVVLDNLPLNANSKIDRTRLKELL